MGYCELLRRRAPRLAVTYFVNHLHWAELEKSFGAAETPAWAATPWAALRRSGTRYDFGVRPPMTLLEQIRATPNLLTLLRLFLIPFLVINLLDHHNGVALSLFLLAGFSDALDGQIARRWGQSTRLGQYLDPIADKLMLSTLFLTVTHMRLVPQYVTVLVFARDLGILLISTLLYATNTMRDFRPSLLGKLNTVVQLATVLLVLVEAVRPTEPWWTIRGWMLIAVAWLAPLSAAQYALIVTRTVSADTPSGPGERDGAEPAGVSPAAATADSTVLPVSDAVELS